MCGRVPASGGKLHACTAGAQTAAIADHTAHLASDICKTFIQSRITQVLGLFEGGAQPQLAAWMRRLLGAAC